MLTLVYLVMALLYIPILWLVVTSFNGGFTYYAELFTNSYYMGAVGNTLLIAAVSSLIATIIATMAATGITYLGKKSRAVTMAVNQLPVMNADIVTSFSLVLLFVALGVGNFGYFKLILAHTVIALPFALLTILPKMQQLDANLIDAALDLGASPFKAFASVIVPQLVPAMLQAFLLGFTLSMDDFVVTQYNNSGVPTISTVVYGAISRRDIPNAFKALTTIIFLVILVVLVIMNLNAARIRKGIKLNRKVVAVVAAVAILAGVGGLVPTVVANLTPRSQILKIYNWEDYLDMDLLAEFEAAHPGLKVEYHTFTDNEELYTKIKSQKADYDLIFPSEYMVEKMQRQGLLRPIDTTKLENYNSATNPLADTVLNLTAGYTAVADQPDAVWAIPYAIGTVGLMYDLDVLREMVPELNAAEDEDVDAYFLDLVDEAQWGTLFGGNDKVKRFKNHITMKKSARDSVGTAMLYAHQTDADFHDNLSDILNMQNGYQLADADRVLNSQIREMNPWYENDNGKKSFINPLNHDFAYGLYWSCDAGLAMIANLDDNDQTNLRFVAPSVGTNLWADNFAMPVYGKNPDAAYEFINFLLDAETAGRNSYYIGSQPAAADAREAFTQCLLDDYELTAADLAADAFFQNYLNTVYALPETGYTADQLRAAYAIMDDFDNTLETAVNNLMITIMNRASQLNEAENGSLNWFLIVIGALAVAALIWYLIYVLTHRRPKTCQTDPERGIMPGQSGDCLPATAGGKSGQQMATRKLTACRGDAQESATENKPPRKR